MNTKAENKICEHCHQPFVISNEEFNLYKKVNIEQPLLCFLCRTKQLFSFWPFGKFRKGVSALSGESLITVLPENSRFPIYTLHEWHSDAWDAMQYGQDYDENISFFEQMKNLQERVPRPHQIGSKNTECDWCDDAWSSKKCYLTRSALECEDLYYSYRNIYTKNSIDMCVCFKCERSYACADCHNSFQLFYSMHSRDCINSYFLYDCRNCQNCFMCSNLRNKQYCIENVQYSKEEYENKMSEINSGSYEKVQELKLNFQNFLKEKAVHRENYNFRVHDSTGEYLDDVKSCRNCIVLSEAEDCFNCTRNTRLKSCIDLVGCFGVELSGNCAICQGSGYQMKYCLDSSSRYSEYLDMCVECENCFACIGLKKKKYCIFNKQYSKEEYEALKEKIISDMRKRGEYGRFFPYSMSLVPFNFSTGILYYPDTTKQEIDNLGGYWHEVDESKYEGMQTDNLPDDIRDVPDDIVTRALICPESKWRFNIAQNELIFYKANNIPLPRLHFDLRIKNTMKYLSNIIAHRYSCCFCHKEINAYYKPEWGYQKVACEDCYKQNIA